MSLPRYPEYKDSGVAFLGMVPVHWEVSVLRHLIKSIESGVSVNATDTPITFGEIGVLKTSCVYSGEFDPNENKVVVAEEMDRVACPVTAGTMIVSRMNTPDLVGAAGFVRSGCDYLFLPDRLWQVHFKDADAAFIHFWTKAPSYRAQVQSACAGTSSSMQNLSQDEFRNFSLPVPPITEQTAIATFLDRETAKIDALIAEQEKLLTLLAEKRQATISHAVTKGLDPDVPMKDSGVEWLGEVPAHWVMRRLRSIAALNPSKSEITGLPKDTQVSFLPMEAIGEDGSLNLENTRQVKDLETGYTYFRNGDLAVAKITPCFENGKGALMSNLIGGIGFGTTELTIVRPKQELTTPDYLNWIFRSSLFRKLGEASMYGAGGQKRIPDNFVRNFALAFPTLSEQVDITKFLEVETNKLEKLAGNTTRAIDLLKERRSALISAAVTGKIDVRHLVDQEAA